MEVKIIFGSPGTGKTTRLMELYGKELTRYSPKNIAFVTFTRKGVQEGKSRVKIKYGVSDEQCRYFRTLHSLAFMLGGHNKDEILTKKDFDDLNEIFGTRFSGESSKNVLFNHDDKILTYEGIKRNNPQRAKEILGTSRISIPKAERVERNFSEAKKALGKIDFTDLIENSAAKDMTADVKVAFVDEAQDLTPLQWEMVWNVFSGCDRIYIAGDDDQALYRWSGADVSDFLSVEGEKEVLKKSYRLPRNIWRVARQIADGISYRQEKDYEPVSEGGEVYYTDSMTKIPIKPSEGWLILARENSKLVEARKHLTEKLIPFRESGHSWTGERMAHKIDLYNSIRKENRKPTDEEVAKLKAVLDEDFDPSVPWYKAFNWMPYKKNFFLRTKLTTGTFTPVKSEVEVGTFHSSKGGEADNVVVILNTSKLVNDQKQIDMDNELRCLYVACTRAKKRLYLLEIPGRYTYKNDLINLGVKAPDLR